MGRRWVHLEARLFRQSREQCAPVLRGDCCSVVSESVRACVLIYLHNPCWLHRLPCLSAPLQSCSPAVLLCCCVAMLRFAECRLPRGLRPGGPQDSLQVHHGGQAGEQPAHCRSRCRTFSAGCITGMQSMRGLHSTVPTQCPGLRLLRALCALLRKRLRLTCIHGVVHLFC